MTDTSNSFEQSLADLAAAADGHRPTDAQLAVAPLITDWDFTTFPGTQSLCIYGYVTGHPLLDDGYINTSPLRAIADSWALTESRYYKIGVRYHD